jgi:uncharacterized protein (AIM24 family)
MSMHMHDRDDGNDGDNMDDADEVTKQGIQAFYADDQTRAIACFSRATQLNPHHQVAWLWLAYCVDDTEEQRQCLERVVAINPNNEAGKRASADLALLTPLPVLLPPSGLLPPQRSIQAPLPPGEVAPNGPVIDHPPVDEAYSYTVPGQNVSVIERADSPGTSVEVIEYRNLSGSDDVHIAQQLFFAQQVGMRLRQVRIILRKGEAIIEGGTLHFMKGNIAIDTSMGGIGGLARKLASKYLARETMFKPRYRGTGELHLEPSFGHFIISYLDREKMVIDSGMFYASEGSVDIGVAMQQHLSATLVGGENLFQTRLSGTGWCVLCSPVPSNEIVRYQLHNEKLCVDGNFALLRKGNIDFRVERSRRSLHSSLTSGEGLMQTFTGTGEVWIAPTQSVYEYLKQRGERGGTTSD